jgi:hypothetical protein
MNFDELSNPWSEFRLPDGRLMRIRHVLAEVICTGVDATGSQMYHLNFAPPIVWIEPTPEQKLAQIAETAPKGALQ